MTSYWDGRLAAIAQIDVPDQRLNDAYKAGFIYTQIVKDGNNLNVGENNYDRLFDHDLVGILANLFEQGDLGNAKAYLATLFQNEYPDAGYKFSWPWALYLEKTGDTQYVSAHFADLRAGAHAIQTAATGPGGTMKTSNAVDSQGNWTVDDQSALTGLLAYRYISERLGNTTETAWAKNEYATLFAAVNKELQATVSANNLSYVPCAVDVPNAANRCFGSTNDANWASSLLFGRWNWDGLLFGADPTGPMATLLDATYQAGFAHLSGLPPTPTGDTRATARPTTPATERRPGREEVPQRRHLRLPVHDQQHPERALLLVGGHPHGRPDELDPRGARHRRNRFQSAHVGSGQQFQGPARLADRGEG